MEHALSIRQHTSAHVSTSQHTCRGPRAPAALRAQLFHAVRPLRQCWYFYTNKQVLLRQEGKRTQLCALAFALRGLCVSICTLVPVKQVNWVYLRGLCLSRLLNLTPGLQEAEREAVQLSAVARSLCLQLLRQYLYFCTSKASKLSTWSCARSFSASASLWWINRRPSPTVCSSTCMSACSAVTRASA